MAGGNFCGVGFELCGNERLENITVKINARADLKIINRILTGNLTNSIRSDAGETEFVGSAD
jgi:hypothetical protein